MEPSILKSTARIRPAMARAVATCALIALPATPTAPIVATHPPGAASIGPAALGAATLRYTIRFEGVGAEGVDNIWRGPLGDDMPGEITLRVEYRGAPMDVARPVWRVRVMTFVAADDPTKSLLAESQGVLDWDTGSMQLTGYVSEGWMKGASVEQTLRLDRTHFDGSGVLRVSLAVAHR